MQGIRPRLITGQREMDIVGEHARERRALGVGELRGEVEKADRLAVGERGEGGVDAGASGNDGRVIRWQDAHEDDLRRRGLEPAGVEETLHAELEVGDLRVVERAGDVVGAGEDHDDARVDAIEFAVLRAPEDVLEAVGAPREVTGVPAGERGVPVREESGVVGRTPAAGDRVADEIQIDAALAGLREQLLVREGGVRIGAWRRRAGGLREEFAGEREECGGCAGKQEPNAARRARWGLWRSQGDGAGGSGREGTRRGERGWGVHAGDVECNTDRARRPARRKHGARSDISIGAATAGGGRVTHKVTLPAGIRDASYRRKSEEESNPLGYSLAWGCAAGGRAGRRVSGALAAAGLRTRWLRARASQWRRPFAHVS